MRVFAFYVETVSMLNKSINLTGLLYLVSGLLGISFLAPAQAEIPRANVGEVIGQVSAIDETLSVVVRNISDNSPVPDNRITIPDGTAVVTSPQYLEVSFQSNVLGAFVRISTDNRRRAPDGRTLANPAFKSGEDGILGTADDEKFEPETGVSGAGLVGTRTKGHGYVVPIFWVVFDNPRSGGYTFAADYSKEAVVLDKAQTHSFGAGGVLQYEPFDSAGAQAYASIIVAPNFSNGKSVGLIASFPEHVDDPAHGIVNGLRSAVSPVAVYLGVNFTGAPGPMTYSTNTLELELVHQ